MIKIGQALQEGTKAILNSGVGQTPLLDASLLLMKAANLTRPELYTHSEKLLTIDQYSHFKDLVTQRLNHHPIAYLIGYKEFYNLKFLVNEDVLIPRSDSEVLVEQALEILNNYTSPTVLDLATGSGALGISVAYNNQSAKVTLADISGAALQVAKQNSKNLLNYELEGVLSDLFSALQKRKFNTIITNPPYLSQSWYLDVEPQVKKEPQLALIDEGEDGLTIIGKIVNQSPTYLEDGGVLLIECDMRQNNTVASLMKTRGFTNVSQRSDYADKLRIVWGYWYEDA